MTDIYFKCTFDVFVRLDEAAAQKMKSDVLLVVSSYVGNACGLVVKQLNDASTEASAYKAGEITTKYYSAGHGKKKFGSRSPNA